MFEWKYKCILYTAENEEAWCNSVGKNKAPYQLKHWTFPRKMNNNFIENVVHQWSTE